MTDYAHAINQQYGTTDLGARVLSILQKAGKNIDALTQDDLSSFDQFHIGGIIETRKLAHVAGIEPGMRILDVGSGLGGPARVLAAEFGCHVTGIDLTEEFCKVAEMLTERVGLAHQVSFKHGSALDMSFPDNSFDVVWTQFAGMNIENKARLYDQMRAVLKDGGILAMHEIMAGPVEGLHFPVLWANDPSISFLKPPEEIRGLLAEKGFTPLVWNDITSDSNAWFESMIARASQPDRPPGFDVFILENVAQKAGNILHSLRENRIVVMQIVSRLAK